MRLIETGRDHLLIEHEGEQYRLGGEFATGGFWAIKSWISRPVGEHLVDLSEEETEQIISLVKKYWNIDNMCINFVEFGEYDLDFICSTRKVPENFTVSRPRIIFAISSFLFMCFAAAMIFYTVFAEFPHPAVYIVVTLTVFFPCAILMLRERLFKVTVNGHRIMVRGYTGVKYSFDLSEIEKLEWKLDYKDSSKSTFTIKTASKSIVMSTRYKGIDDLKLLLYENVDESKRTYIRVNAIKKEKN
ncbi:MAG: hypothetical protein NC417_08420 [Candidatus Gastranaerophilales bacterium]|nr:hypothetical protein [Candidatus Gastranaerophilales bacterium]